jgi:glycosyltransferase involved in cell wall biosynthesis
MATYIITTSPIGSSVPNYFFSIADELHRRGHTVVVITDKNKPQLLPQNEERKFYYSWPGRRPTTIKDFIFFYKLCRQHKPDCVIGNFGAQNIVMLTGRLLNIKYRVAYWHTVFEALKVDSTNRNSRNSFLHLRKKWLLRLLPTHIFTNSDANRGELIEHYRLQPSHIYKFPLLIPDPLKGKAPVPTRGNVICFNGRLDKSKRQEILLKAVPELLKTFPDLQVHIAGTGSEDQYLRDLCKKLNIESVIHFAGGVFMDEVYRILSMSKVHVSASVHEGFGLANVEALAMGTPVVAPPVGGIKEVLEDGKNGFFFNPDIENDIAEKITAIMNDNWESYSNNARRSFLEKFCTVNIAKQIDIYEQLFP